MGEIPTTTVRCKSTLGIGNFYPLIVLSDAAVIFKRKLRRAGLKLRHWATNPCGEIPLTPTGFQDATIRVESRHIPDFVMITSPEVDTDV